MRQPRRKLTQRRQTVCATHRIFRLQQMPVGLRQLFRRSFVTGRLRANRLPQRIHQHSRNSRQQTANHQNMFGFVINRECMPVNEKQKRKIGGGRNNGTEQRARNTQIAGRGNDGQQQHQIVRALQTAGNTDQQISQSELKDHRTRTASSSVKKCHAAFNQLQHRQPGHERHLPNVMRQISERAQHQGKENILRPHRKPEPVVDASSQGHA